MNRTRIAAALTSILATGSIGQSDARADFQFSNTRSSSTIGGVTYDRVTLYARNDGTGHTAGGTKLLGLDIAITSSGAMRFETGHANDTAVNGPTPTFYESDLGLDVLLTAPTATLAAGGNTSTRVLDEVFSDTVLTLFPTTPKSNSKGGFNPVTAYANRSTFSLLGAALGTPAVPAGTGLGAAIASVLTVPGATVTISGRIGGDTGTSGPAGAVAASTTYVPYAYAAVAPEPGAISMAIAALGVVSRRRR